MHFQNQGSPQLQTWWIESKLKECRVHFPPRRNNWTNLGPIKRRNIRKPNYLDYLLKHEQNLSKVGRFLCK